MHINNISDFRKAWRHGQYAWPGGYPTFWMTSDGGVLSWEAARQERYTILHSIAHGINDGFRVCALVINYEDDLHCDHTGKRIESAYGNE